MKLAQRYIGRATGRHRHTPSAVTVPLDTLLGKPSAYTDVPPVQGVLTQAWRPCSGSCGQEMPSVVHPNGSHTCGHCFTTTVSEGDQ